MLQKMSSVNEINDNNVTKKEHAPYVYRYSKE